MTTDSTEDFSWLHHRMPVILTKDKLNIWLNHDYNQMDLENFAKNELSLSITKVSPIVNSVKNNSPDCKKPLSEVKQEGISKFFSGETKPDIKKEDKQTPIQVKINPTVTVPKKSVKKEKQTKQRTPKNQSTLDFWVKK